jgi:EAL domain-containing protein (putative c-di-GMP-specific phosphodiesterase class I)
VRFALYDERLRLATQPIVDLRTGKKVAEELLLRFIGPDGRPELPGPYISAVESCTLGTRLDMWVCARALQMAKPGRRVHVNLSARTVTDPAFGDWLVAAVQRYETDPSFLTFEITETAPVIDLPSARDVTSRIAALGARFALDDFGTGYGSLSHLHHLPVTTLKIDREFIAALVADERSRALVGSIVDMARRLGMQAIAEGVENEATLRALRQCGVDLAQGFHIGMPQIVRP